MSVFTLGARVVVALAALALAACASYSPDYQALNQQSARAHSQPLAVDADIAELIRYAQRNHPSVKAAEAGLVSARAASGSAGAFADPQLNMSQCVNDRDSL